MAKDDALARSLKQVRDLIQRLHASDAADPVLGSMFFQHRLGGVGLTQKQTLLFRTAAQSLRKAVARTTASMSATEIDRALQLTVLRTLRPRRDKDDRASFERRLTRELRKLRQTLRRPPRNWRVLAEVAGVSPSALPFRFGRVDFNFVTLAQATTIASEALADFVPPGRAARAAVEAEQAVRAQSRLEIATQFADRCLASLTVGASDGEAAHAEGLAQLQATLDVLNFFVPHLSDVPNTCRLLCESGSRLPSAVLAWDVDDGTAVWQLSGATHSLTDAVDPIGPKGKLRGLDRVHRVLQQSEPTSLDRRVLAAVGWAGRASAEPRRDLAFLSWALALEALLSKAASRTGVTERIRLRAAHLVGKTRDLRLRAGAIVGELYAVRSELVHGTAIEVTPETLDSMARLVTVALHTVLVDPRFTSMRECQEFERYLDERAFD